MEALRPNLALVLFVLVIFAAYLVTATLASDRISPPIFFTIALCLSIAPFRPSLVVAALSVGGIVFANLLFALDHIHGECAYDVLWGQDSWHKPRLGDLAYFRQCSQPSLAFWLLVIAGFIWAFVLLRELRRQFAPKFNRIELSQQDDLDNDSGR